MKKLIRIAATLTLGVNVASAQDIASVGPEVLPEDANLAAPETATIDGLTGPTEASGVSIEWHNSLFLGDIFPLAEADQRFYRGRKITVAPGGIVPIHSHKGRPAITFVAEGEIVEYRSDADGPIAHSKGGTTFDKGGVAQWWENKSDAAAILLVVDIVAVDRGEDAAM